MLAILKARNFFYPKQSSLVQILDFGQLGPNQTGHSCPKSRLVQILDTHCIGLNKIIKYSFLKRDMILSFLSNIGTAGVL